MTIDEAIKHAEEVAEKQKSDWAQCPRSEQEPICSGLGICTIDKSDGCLKSAEKYEQLAEWLKELKMYRKALNQESMLDAIKAKIEREIIPRESALFGSNAVWQNSGVRNALKAIDKYREEIGAGMKKDASDVLTVSFDSSLKDESALCVSRIYEGDKIIILKMEYGEQADILYHLLTEQTTKAEIKIESDE